MCLCLSSFLFLKPLINTLSTKQRPVAFLERCKFVPLGDPVKGGVRGTLLLDEICCTEQIQETLKKIIYS